MTNEKKKNFWCSERMGYCPLYCKTRFVLQYEVAGLGGLYCMAEIVLQYGGLEGLEGLFFLYCNTHGVLWLRRDLGLRIVLQYNYCIAIEWIVL